MKDLSKLKYIFVHCTAGYGTVASIVKFWREVKKWRGNGYTIIIDEEGTQWYITKNKTYSTDVLDCDWTQITNGVLGYNGISISIAYIGGVKKDNYKIAEDTRTFLQKVSLHMTLVQIRDMLFELIPSLKEELVIVGHRDASKDKNNNNTIESWERIKECPSFDALGEYKKLHNNPIKRNEEGYLEI
jgi:N-acetylmuramoyl-L-alanine amidase